MKRDLNIELTDVFGEPMKVDGKEETLSRLIISALMQDAPGEEKPDDPGVYKLEKYALAIKLRDHMHNKESTIDLTEREVALIRRAVTPKYATLVVGQVESIIKPE